MHWLGHPHAPLVPAVIALGVWLAGVQPVLGAFLTLLMILWYLWMFWKEWKK